MPELPENIIQAREAASQQAGVAGQYAAGAFSIEDILKEKVNKAYTDNADIIGKLNESLAGYWSAPSEAREKYLSPDSPSKLRDPFAAESLVSKYTAGKAIPMLNYSSILGQRFGRIEDLVGAGARAYQGVSTAAQNKAQLAQQQYQNLLNEFQLTQPQTQTVEAGGRILLIDSQTGQTIQDLGAAKSTGGGGGSGFDNIKLMELVYNMDLDGDGSIGPGGASGSEWELLPSARVIDKVSPEYKSDTGYEFQNVSPGFWDYATQG